MPAPELDNVLGVLFLSPEAFTARARSFGIDVTGVSPEDVKTTLALASRAVEAHCGRSFVPGSLVETHQWNSATRRVTVNQPPVITLESFVVEYAPGVTLPFRVEDITINNQENYLEVASLALSAGLGGTVQSLGLVEPLVRLSYKSYQSVPGAVAAAVGFTAAHFLNESAANEFVPAGLASYKVANTAFSRRSAGVELPPIARQLLSPFVRIAVA